MHVCFSRTFAVFGAFLLIATLAACGGGTSSSAPPAAPAQTLAISGFSPASGGVGDVITVTGTGFASVTQAKVDDIDATFAIDSATQLRVTIPPGATTGRIEVSGAGHAALAATDLAIVAVPQVTNVTPATLTP